MNENRKNEKDRNDKKWIIWTCNNIGVEGARMIGESLKINTTLTILYLTCDEIEVNEKTKKYKYNKYEIQKEKEKKKAKEI